MRRLAPVSLAVAALAAAPALVLADSGPGSGGGGGGGGGGTVTPPPPSTSTFTIDPGGPFNVAVGENTAIFFSASGGQGTPFRFRIVSGSLPPGLRFTESFGVQSAAATGTPTTSGSFTFALRAQDTSGHTTPSRSFTINVGAPAPLVITNGTSTLTPGTVGRSYAINLFAGGGVQPYRWAIVAGALPPGLRLSGNQINGTPTTRGTFTFTARVTDARGATASQPFSITIS